MNAMKKNPAKFCLSLAACVLGLIALVLYLTTGVIPGFTEKLLPAAIIVLALSVLCNLVFTFVRVNTLEALPFAGYIVSAMLILYANAEYLVAVVRAIDVTTVQPSLIITIVLAVCAAIVYALSFLPKKKED